MNFFDSVEKEGKNTPPPPTFVIFDFPFFAVLVRGVLLAPLFVFGGGVKRHGLGGFRFFGPGAWDTFHDGGDEDLEKIFNLQQTGPKMVEKIHNQPFDVAAVVVLVGHDHDVPVPQPRSVVVPENQSHQNKKRQCLLLLSLVVTHQLHSTPRSMPHRAPSWYLHSVVGRGSSSTSTTTSTTTMHRQSSRTWCPTSTP